MHYRPVLTPSEEKPINVEKVCKLLDEGRALLNAELALVFEQLPVTIYGNHPFPSLVIEKSMRYTDSVALVMRERKKFLGVFPYIKEERVDLCVHRLTDFAHELLFFESRVVAGDMFVREATSGVSHGELTMRCNAGIYELESSVFDMRVQDATATSCVRMKLSSLRELATKLRGFGVSEKRWRENNNLVSH